MKWNAFFLSINACMTVKLLLDYYEAKHMPDEMNLLYDQGHFCHTFSKVQFNRFFKFGRRRELKPGEVIIRGGQLQTKLYYTEHGECTAMVDRRKVGNILSHRFVGEMSYLKYLKNSKPGAEENPCDSAHASATVIAKTGGIIWEWDHEDLTKVLLEEMDISNAFQSYCAFDLGMKLLAVNEETGLSPYQEAKYTSNSGKKERMPDEMNVLYDQGHFCDTFSKAQFNRFFKLGKRRELKPGEVIIRGGQLQTKLYYTEHGECTAMVDRRKVGNILSHRFVGEMSYLKYLKNSKPGAEENPCDSAHASATVIAKTGGIIWEWDHEDLTKLLTEDLDISNAFQSHCAFDLGLKLLAVNEETGLSPYLEAKYTSNSERKDGNKKNEKKEKAIKQTK